MDGKEKVNEGSMVLIILLMTRESDKSVPAVADSPGVLLCYIQICLIPRFCRRSDTKMYEISYFYIKIVNKFSKNDSLMIYSKQQRKMYFGNRQIPC